MGKKLGLLFFPYLHQVSAPLLTEVTVIRWETAPGLWGVACLRARVADLPPEGL